MPYKPVKDEPESMNRVAGVKFVETSAGSWKVKAFTLADLWRFQAVLTGIITNPSKRSWTRFFQTTLEDREPGIWTKVRRMLGLPDYSARVIARSIQAADIKTLRNEIVKFILDMSYEDYVKRCEEAVKKKVAAEKSRTGEKSPDCCSSSEACRHGNCSG